MPEKIAPFDPLTRGRLLQLMDALEHAGGTPISLRDLHAFAYFGNVLSPLWEIEPIEGSVLKERGGPYFPTLQREIDSCVGNGFLVVVQIRPIVDESGHARIDATLRLSMERARPMVDLITGLPDEARVRAFLIELAFGFLDIRTDRRDEAALADAAWSDPSVDESRVIDFAEWVESTYENPTWNAAQRFQKFAPVGVTLSRAEKLVMYMRLMKRRAYG